MVTQEPRQRIDINDPNLLDKVLLLAQEPMDSGMTQLQMREQEYWNLAIQIASQIGPNSDRIQAILRDVSIILMRHGLQNQTLTCTVQAQIVEMMFKCAKAFLNLNETTKTTEYIKDASQLLRTISGLSDERFTTLKYQLKLLQAELEWKSKSESSFYIVNTIISDCVEHLDGKELSKLCKKIIDFGISSSAGPDRLRWFTNAQKTLNAKKMGSFFAPLEAQLLKLMVKERIETKEFEVVDQMIDMLLERHKSLDVYHLLLEYCADHRSGDFSLVDILTRAKEEVLEEIQTKQGLTKYISMIQYASQKGCDEAHLLLDDIINSKDMEVQLGKQELVHQVMITKIFLLLKSNTLEAIQEIKKVLRDAELDLSTCSSKTCLAMFWKHGDELASQENYQDAIEYYSLACKLFTSNLTDSRNHAIVQRKMAMSFLYLQDAHAARECCLKAIGLDSRTSELNDYIMFMIYMRMKDVDQAILHLENLSFTSRPDLFIAAADVAYQVGNNQVIKQILKKVMMSGINLQEPRIIQHVQIILRSLIRISYDKFIETQTLESQNELLGHIITDCKMVKKAMRNQDQNELDWLFRIAWNSAFQVSKSDATFPIKTQYFEIVMELYKLFQSPEEVHTDCCEKACFMSIWYRLQSQEVDQDNLEKALEAIAMWKDLTKLHDGVLFYEFEVYCLLKDWDRARNLITQAKARVLDSSIWKKCSAVSQDLTAQVLENTLESLIKSERVDVEEYIQWSRVMVQTLIGTNDRLHCFKYSNQIKVLLGERTVVNMEDVLWISIKYWNYGTELISAGDQTGGKVWIEHALGLGEYCKGYEQIENMKRTFQRLLSQ